MFINNVDILSTTNELVDIYFNMRMRLTSVELITWFMSLEQDRLCFLLADAFHMCPIGSINIDSWHWLTVFPIQWIHLMQWIFVVLVPMHCVSRSTHNPLTLCLREEGGREI